MTLSRGIADTSLFLSAAADRADAADAAGRPLDETELPDELAVSVITIAELRAGVLAATDIETRDRRLATFTEALALEPIPIDQPIAETWARLALILRAERKRMPANLSWIAATAMSLRTPIVTRDAAYVELPGLEVIRV